jgi:methionine sulfoxide reductase heme-binding subunit
LVRNRRYLGLCFAIAHTIHLGALTSYFVFIGEMPGMEAVVGGGLAYSLMFIMAATSNDQSMKALGRNWGRLHTVGLHYLWFIFLVTYLGRLSDGESGTDPGSLFMVGIVGSGLAFTALALRLAAMLKKRSRKTAG